MNESYTKAIEKRKILISKNDAISALIFVSLLSTPTNIQAITLRNKNDIKNTIELKDTTNLLDKISQKLWIILPSQYNENLKNFISNNITLTNEAAAKFTEDFIYEQMSQNRWISKENQYLFIWSTIYTTLTNLELYDWSDWNQERYNEYEIAFDYLLNCEETYKTNLKKIMEHELEKSENDLQQSRDDLQKSRDDLQQSRDDLQQSRDDLQQSRDDLQQSRDDLQNTKNNVMQSDTLLLNEIINFYKLYKNNINVFNEWELMEIKRIAKETIEACQKDKIDYKNYFIQKLWDYGKVEELLRICEIE